VDDPYLLAGRFGAEARLSPKALRLYAELGLLVPTEVDPATGYRYYHRDQLDRARLIGRLRGLELPLARIATLLDLTPEALEIELRAWLKARHDQLGRQAQQILEPTAADLFDHSGGRTAGIETGILIPRRREPVGAKRGGQPGADDPAVEPSARASQQAARDIARELVDDGDRVDTLVSQRPGEAAAELRK
jgi:DNA-binding transcriptional MerR regulator